MVHNIYLVFEDITLDNHINMEVRDDQQAVSVTDCNNKKYHLCEPSNEHSPQYIEANIFESEDDFGNFANNDSEDEEDFEVYGDESDEESEGNNVNKVKKTIIAFIEV